MNYKYTITVALDKELFDLAIKKHLAGKNRTMMSWGDTSHMMVEAIYQYVHNSEEPKKC